MIKSFKKILNNNKELKPVYLAAFLGEIYFIIPVWLFFYLRFLDYKQIAILVIIQSVVTNLAELPTGALADLIGRKRTLVITYLIYASSLLLYVLGGVFLVFVIAEVGKGIAKAMYSGSFEAIVYDTLKEKKKENIYDKVVADLESLSWLALFVSSFLGGILYDFWFRLPYLLVVINYYLIALLFLFFVREPKIDSEKFTLKNYISQNRKGFKEIFANQRIGLISLILIVITFAYFMASEYLGISQAKQYGLSGTGVGILFGTGYIIAAIGSQFYPKLKRWFGNKKLLVLICVILSMSFVGAKYVGLIIGSMLIISRISSSTSFRNLKSSMVNSYVTSRNRATALSSMNLLVQIPFALIVYFAGDYIDSHSPNEFAFWFGAVFIIFLTMLFLRHIQVSRS